MEEERIVASKVLAETFSILAREKALALILVIIVAAFTTAISWPFLGIYSSMFQNLSLGGQVDPATLQAFEGMSQYLILLFVPFLLVNFALMVVWSRASIRGRKAALEGGFPALIKRALWVFWRYICLLGWSIVLAGILMIAMILLALFVGLTGAVVGTGSGGQVVLGVLGFIVYLVVYVPVLLAMSALMVLFSISLCGEANDIRLPIHTSYKAMDGNILRASGIFLAVLVGFEIFYMAGLLTLTFGLGGEAAVTKVLGLFIIMLFGSVFYFFNISYGAIYASKVVPELESLDFKSQLKDVF